MSTRWEKRLKNRFREFLNNAHTYLPFFSFALSSDELPLRKQARINQQRFIESSCTCPWLCEAQRSIV
ncbi:hypothetical protein ARMA_0691 [Ardenticatena maritima]|uniref:Uncharacterized protein n=1 Tax=Ardenticatena maritima TaxID=872965 RepID=A0A0M9UBV6_9CHLR|nr:hypothetical protein ARMA_0691 [Ardenticatena maritima]